jgi:hypothetical protein
MSVPLAIGLALLAFMRRRNRTTHDKH